MDENVPAQSRASKAFNPSGPPLFLHGKEY